MPLKTNAWLDEFVNQRLTPFESPLAGDRRRERVRSASSSSLAPTAATDERVPRGSIELASGKRCSDWKTSGSSSSTALGWLVTTEEA
jgi:hypothetical protein